MKKTVIHAGTVAVVAAVTIIMFGAAGCGDWNVSTSSDKLEKFLEGFGRGVTPPQEHVHDWGDWVVTTQPTCEAEGVEMRTCKLDSNHIETDVVAKLTGEACESGGEDTTGNGGSGDVYYDFVEIGGLKWMTKNLDIETEDSWCYDDNPDNCAKYGRLYTWNAAMTACPNGWHLPSRQEWDVLMDLAGESKEVNVLGDDDTCYYYPGAGMKLKSTSGWNENEYNSQGGNGTNYFGFSALPGDGAGQYGYWWTATDTYSLYHSAYYIYMRYDNINVYEDFKYNSSMSVRCVHDY